MNRIVILSLICLFTGCSGDYTRIHIKGKVSPSYGGMTIKPNGERLWLDVGGNSPQLVDGGYYDLIWDPVKREIVEATPYNPPIEIEEEGVPSDNQMLHTFGSQPGVGYMYAPPDSNPIKGDEPQYFSGTLYEVTRLGYETQLGTLYRIQMNGGDVLYYATNPYNYPWWSRGRKVAIEIKMYHGGPNRIPFIERMYVMEEESEDSSSDVVAEAEE